jgi:hypothetical protein
MREGWSRASVYATHAGGYASQAGGRAARALHRTFTFLATYPPLAQGVYYLLTGLWPLVSVGTYHWLTRHQGDVWLAQSVGVLTLVIGATLCLAAYRRQSSPEILLLAFGSALGMAAVDFHLFFRGYSALYLLDAVLELALVAFWVYAWRRSATRVAAPPAAIPLNGTAQATPQVPAH